MFIQRTIAIARAKKLLADGASIDHVLGNVWNEGFIEGGEDEKDCVSAEFDRRVDEIRQEVGAVYGTRDVIQDMKKEIDMLRQRLSRAPTAPPA